MKSGGGVWRGLCYGFEQTATDYTFRFGGTVWLCLAGRELTSDGTKRGNHVGLSIRHELH